MGISPKGRLIWSAVKINCCPPMINLISTEFQLVCNDLPKLGLERVELLNISEGLTNDIHSRNMIGMESQINGDAES
jgi:hypothetical protein